MTDTSYSYSYLMNETESLLTRMEQVKPFAMTMPMVKGASVSDEAFRAVNGLLEKGRSEIYDRIKTFSALLQKSSKDESTIRRLQKMFTVLKLRYNSILDQLDIFADVFSQRAEHDTGIWLSGLDVLAADGLSIGRPFFEIPPVMVFLERGHGAAIRRARTRLPGGDENPASVIQIPRERMVGSGIASSLIHEVGHQAAESLELTRQIRAELNQRKASATKNQDAWRHYERWISEILADVWAMGHLGVTATTGLMGVVTLPKYFQFRLDLEDPHPAPYIRVQLSCAFGKALFPHPQWDKLSALWDTFYATGELPADKKQLLQQLKEEEDAFVQLVLQYQSPSLKGGSLKDIFPVNSRQPHQLQQLYRHWIKDKSNINKAPPTLVFAVLGQAKHDYELDAVTENHLLTQQLRSWAYNRK